jgi:hypothetical protein
MRGDEQASQNLPCCNTDCEDHRVGTDRAGATLSVELHLDDREHLRRHQRRRRTLKGPRDDQRPRIGGETAGQRADRKCGQTHDECAPFPEDVPESGAADDEGAERQRVRREDQLKLSPRRVQARAQARRRDDQDRGIHRRHRLSDEQNHKCSHSSHRADRQRSSTWTFVLCCKNE